MRLEDTAVVVTGASRGLGRAMADAFVREGARVVYAARDEDRLAAAVDDIRSSGATSVAHPAEVDVRSWASVQQLVEQAEDRFGRVDVLVNNAGVTQATAGPDHIDKPVCSLAVETWDTVLDTNLRGAFLCAKAVLPGMLERGDGRLVHVSSGHGQAGRANRAAYVASKFGLEGLHETLALELEGTGVESVALRPPGGGVYTERAGEIGRSPDDFAHRSPTVIAEAAVQLAAGAGENGGRYRATADGGGVTEYGRGAPSS